MSEFTTPHTTKRVIVHLGPHRTGAKSIDAYLTSRDADLARLGVTYLPAPSVQRVAQVLTQPADEALSSVRGELSELVCRSPGAVVLFGSPNFSGELIGRRGCKTLYPHLLRNILFLEKELAGYDLTFTFIRREMAQWLSSVYNNHVEVRRQFTSFEDFLSWLDGPMKWEVLLKSATSAVRKITVTDYFHEPAVGVQTIADAALLPKAWVHEAQVPWLNRGPSADLVSAYERINDLAFDPRLIPQYKQRARRYHGYHTPTTFGELAGDDWPPRHEARTFCGLEGLWARTRRRIPRQSDLEDILPDEDTDLARCTEVRLDKDFLHPGKKRRLMQDQEKLLRYHLRGKTELSLLNALCISYLRRDSPHTSKARHLFQRIWSEHGLLLAYELNTRWLISTLQTFLDHGSPEQKVIGAAGYFYGNMLKIYEGERAIENRPANSMYESSKPRTEGGFPGLDRFELGKTDLLLNTNALLLELAATDWSAGIVLEELLLRTKAANTVFSRMDASVIEQRVESMNGNMSSFFEPNS